MPTASMFSCIASAIGRLKCLGHAAPTMRRGRSVVSVIRAAPSAICCKAAKLRRMSAASISRMKYHTVAAGGTTFGGPGVAVGTGVGAEVGTGVGVGVGPTCVGRMKLVRVVIVVPLTVTVTAAGSPPAFAS